MKADEFLILAQERFLQAGVERPRWTLDQICSAYFHREPIDLITNPPPFDANAIQDLWQNVERRCSGIPLQHITGIAGFFGHDFKCTPAALVPRPETERLVEVATEEIRKVALNTPAGSPRVVDVGTGSGIIAICLTLTLGIDTILGLDLDPQALALARENGSHLGVSHQVSFVQGDLLSHFSPSSADVVVANLPYIPSEELKTLPPEVQQDPVLALDGGLDGLALIRRLMDQAAQVLTPQGVIVLEVGLNQAASLKIEYADRWSEFETVNDDNGIERVVIFRKPQIK